MRFALKYLLIILVLAGLYCTSFINYLLFHSLVELFSIVVASGLFMIAWGSKKYIKNPYLLFVGIAYLFIAFLDLLHTLSYKGMQIFTDYDYYANQLWIAARFIESLSLLVGLVFLRKAKSFNPYVVLTIFATLTALVVASIMYWKIFPECFVEGVGLTPFKKDSEYLICGILGLTLFLLRQNRQSFEPRVYRLIMASICCTVVSELAFTFYINNYGFSNLVGHYFKLFSYYLLYLAIIETCLDRPYEMIFRELDKSNQKLNQEVEVRRRTEAELRQALEEIRTLQGIIPICASCKKIRNEEGVWDQLEHYISQHSDAKFSHGICPDCMRRLYPELCDDPKKQ